MGRTGYGIVHYHGADMSARLNSFVKTVEHTAAAGHDYSVITQIADQLRRGALQNGVNILEDELRRLAQDIHKI